MTQYETMCVAFVDILGFSERIRESESDDQSFVRVVSALTEIEMQAEGLPNQPGEIHDSIHMVNFSDSLIISAPVNPKSFWKLVLTISKIFSKLVGNGVLLRGAITVGPHYRRDRVAFGPSVIEAYRLEQESCVWPRVMLSKNANNYAQKFAKKDVIYEKYYRNYFKQHEDGVVYLDYFIDYRRIMNDPDDDDIKLYEGKMNLVKASIEEGLANIDRPRIFEKYRWMMEEFNTAVGLTGTYGGNLHPISMYAVTDNRIRHRDPNLISTLIDLPKNDDF